jgi:hypothetical protein
VKRPRLSLVVLKLSSSMTGCEGFAVLPVITSLPPVISASPTLIWAAAGASPTNVKDVTNNTTRLRMDDPRFLSDAAP